MKKIIVSLLFSTNLLAVSAIYNLNMQVDASNEGVMRFETLQDNQVVELSLHTRKLNTSFISAINSDSTKKRDAVEININKLSLIANSTVTLSCNSSDVESSDTLCAEKKCSITQRIISKCNETDCWLSNPNIDRLLIGELSENINLVDKVDISSCISNNVVGYKHSIEFSVENVSSNILAGGSIQATIFLSESKE